MEIVTAAEFQRKFGYYQDRALVDAVVVTRNGRERVVLISAEEYYRLKRLDRQTLSVAELTDAELAAIEAAEVPKDYQLLDQELDK